METHSSILIWKIPWTEEPGGRQSIGSQRVTHWSDLAHIHLHIYVYLYKIWTWLQCSNGLPRWLSGKESTCPWGDTRDTVSIPGLGRSPRGGNGNPLQYSCLENPTDRGAWRATAHGVTESQTQVSAWAQKHLIILPRPLCLWRSSSEQSESLIPRP